ncbi:hypothetical protein F5B20DRAFT_542436 [Whalleya microplaca]|nr:hypothetical protein F5B20DRAFT_542436 [Whalleya microplaca]
MTTASLSFGYSTLLASPAVEYAANFTSISCCQALENAGLANVLYPENALYGQRTESYWSISAQMHPTCIVQPVSADEVSRAVTTLTSNIGCQFAVRSGGHLTWAGSNNIDDGVTIDLGQMNTVSYDEATKVATMQAGANWGQVYEKLAPYGVAAVGGRATQVGVTGFLLGGGNSFYTARHGLACDSVNNFEVVLSNGDIINANPQENADLFRVLKGGSGNFGIVTKIDIQVFEASNLWGGVVLYPFSTADQHIEAYVDWINNVENYPDGSSILIWTYSPKVEDIVIFAAYEDTTGAVSPPGFDKFMEIPHAITSTLRVDSLLNLTTELNMPAGYRDIWSTATFKNDARVYHKANELHSRFVAEWKAQSPDGDFITQLVFQALPTIFASHSLAKGGNVFGLESESENLVLLQFNLAINSVEQEVFGREKSREFREALKAYADEIGCSSRWVYLNYADSNQDPRGSYGPDNVVRMRAAAEKYDPDGVFQTRSQGGFKISKIQTN